MTSSMTIHCDIFCNVIDNFGDIGVCWRLARQLANEHGIAVRLWVDDLCSFAGMCPEADAASEIQKCRGVEVRLWHKEFSEVQPADLVIEAFACKLPDNYIEAMAKIAEQSDRQAKMDARRQSLGERDSTSQYSEGGEAVANNADATLVGRKPVWINLEYLSAEDWVESHHKLPSPHPSLPLTKYFFFPGFTRHTGGLLLECDLLARRDIFLSDTGKQHAFWKSIGMEMPMTETLKISLFGYENAALSGLFDAWAASMQPVLCLVPEGRILPQVGQYFGDHAPHAGSDYARGQLHVRILPFVEQERYDELLWACDVNFVRGEDSFVRAQWAGKPFVWHIYPQHDAVHLKKLQAFLILYGSRLSRPANEALQGMWQAWNSGCDRANGSLRSSGGSVDLPLAGALLIEPLATRLGEQTTLAKSLVMAKPADCGSSREAASRLPAESLPIRRGGRETGAGQAWPAFITAHGELERHAQHWGRHLAENNLALNLLDFYQKIGKMRAFKIEGQ